jgi:hypothetical protein
MAFLQEEFVVERRLRPRREINGPGHVVLPDGAFRNVTLFDLSSTGARISLPNLYEPEIGEELVLAGEMMPWERRAKVVGVSGSGLHLCFD